MILKRRTNYNIMMDILTIFYEYKAVNMSLLIRKCNLNNTYQRELVDILIIKELVNLINNKTLILTPKGELIASKIVMGYKESLLFYDSLKINKNGIYFS